MAKFVHNNAKNTSTNHILSEFNYGFHPQVLFKKNLDSQSRSRLANKPADKLRELIEICCQNLLYTQDLQKRAYDKGVKSCSYTLSKKVWLNSKYIKTKRNKKLENKFFGPFEVFHAIGKQAYKQELSTK